MLEAVNLTKDFGSQRALDALNLTISAGEIYCLMVSNGAGKTTIHLFLHLIEPTLGLDPVSLLLQRMSERGVAVLMATHELFRAHESGTQIGIMRQGKLVADLAAASVSLTELEEAYLTAVS